MVHQNRSGINCGRMTISRERKRLSEGDGFIRKPEKILFCGENKLCITDSCKGKELKSEGDI